MAFRRITSLRNFQRLTKNHKGQHTKYIHSATSDFQLPQLRTPLSAADTDDISECLKKILGDKNVAVSDSVKLQHGQDEGPDKGVPPDIVAFAESTEHVSEVSYDPTMSPDHICKM